MGHNGADFDSILQFRRKLEALALEWNAKKIKKQNQKQKIITW